MTETRLLLLRHGRQSDTRCNVDVGLSREGERQADLAGERMRSWDISSLWASDMLRARETAARVNNHLGLPRVDVEPALREINFGRLEGLYDTEIAEQFADFQARQGRAHHDLHYPGGENAASLLERVLGALERIARASPGPVLIVTHGVVIRTLVQYSAGAPLHRWRTTARRLENGSITELGYETGTGEFSLQRVNDHAHLEPYPELLREAWGVQEN